MRRDKPIQNLFGAKSKHPLSDISSSEAVLCSPPFMPPSTCGEEARVNKIFR